MRSKKKIVLSLIAGLLSFVVYLLFFQGPSTFKHDFSDPRIRDFIKDAKSSISSKEDPFARVEYERMRHADPLTGVIPPDIRERELRFSEKIPAADKPSPLFREQDVVEWIQRGPYNVGGRTRALALDISDETEKTILAGGVSGGMWKTSNGGKSWQKTSLPNQLQSVTSIVQDTRINKTNVWYYGTGELVGNSPSKNASALYRGDGIYKSIDQGQTWQVLPSTVSNTPHIYDSPFDYVWNLAVDPSNTFEDEVYAASLGGIHRSTDGGVTWKLVLGSGTNANRFTDVVVASQGVVYAALSDVSSTLTNIPKPSAAGIYRSEDGITWERISPANFPTLHYRTVIALVPDSPNFIYTITDIHVNNSKSSHLLMKYSPNEGWKDLSENLPSFKGEGGEYDSQNSYNMILRVRPDNVNIVFLGGTSLFRSTDGFSSKDHTSWIGGYNSNGNAGAYPNHHPDLHALFFYKNPVKMISSHDGGISYTSNNLAGKVSWESLNKGYVTSQFYTVAINTEGRSDLLIGGMQDNGIYATNYVEALLPWRKILGGDGAYCAISNDERNIYVSSQYAKLYRQDYDAEGNYEGYTRIDPIGGADYLFVNPFVLDKQDKDLIYLAGGKVVWRNDKITSIPRNNQDSTDIGWTKMTNTAIAEGVISSISISKNPANILYYGTNNGRLYKLTNANSSNIPAEEITGAIFPKNQQNKPMGYVSSVLIDPSDADKVMVAFSNYEVVSLFYSQDGGKNWIAVAGNLEENANGRGAGPSVHWISMLQQITGPIYFAGTSTGVYSTNALDGLNTLWAHEGTNSIGNVVVDMIVARQTDGLVVVGTHGGGVFSAQFDNIPSIGEELSEKVVVRQNWPNPFYNYTRIPYFFEKTSHVKLTIIDSNGKELMTLIDQEKEGGNYYYTWDGRDTYGNKLSYGVYFYKFRIGEKVVTKRLVVIEE